MGGRAVEGTGLENRQGFTAPRGFESHPIRHPTPPAFAKPATAGVGRSASGARPPLWTDGRRRLGVGVSPDLSSCSGGAATAKGEAPAPTEGLVRKHHIWYPLGFLTPKVRGLSVPCEELQDCDHARGKGTECSYQGNCDLPPCQVNSPPDHDGLAVPIQATVIANPEMVQPVNGDWTHARRPTRLGVTIRLRGVPSVVGQSPPAFFANIPVRLPLRVLPTLTGDSGLQFLSSDGPLVPQGRSASRKAQPRPEYPPLELGGSQRPSDASPRQRVAVGDASASHPAICNLCLVPDRRCRFPTHCVGSRETPTA